MREKKWELAGQWLYLVLIFIFLYAPIVVLIVFSFNESRSRGRWGGFSLKWYQSVFHNETIMSALYYTLAIAFLASILATVIGTMAAIAIDRMRKNWQSAFLNVAYIPILSPDIVTGVSLMLLYIFSRLQLGFATLLLTHITFCTPYIIFSVLPKLRQLDYNLYEAALDLGARPVPALVKVVLPELRSGIVTGLLIAFTLSVDDFVISFFTTGSGVSNLAITIFTMARRGVSPEINAISSILFVTVLLLLIIVNIRQEREKKARAF